MTIMTAHLIHAKNYFHQVGGCDDKRSYWRWNCGNSVQVYELLSSICSSLRQNIPVQDIENTSWKVLAYGIYARVVDVSEIERVSAANE